jgi:hypothetical protein
VRILRRRIERKIEDVLGEANTLPAKLVKGLETSEWDDE